MRSIGGRLGTGMALAMAVGWSLACLLPVPHDHDEPVEADDDPSVAGTTLEGSWIGEIDCPSPMASIGLEFDDDASVVGGRVRIEIYDDFSFREIEVVVDGGDTDETQRELVVETPGCEDCPVFEDVVWDLETLPAVIEGDLHHLVPGEVCAFVLEQTRL